LTALGRLTRLGQKAESAEHLMSTMRPRLDPFRAALIVGCGALVFHLALTLLFRGNLPVRFMMSDLLLLAADSLAAICLLFAARRSVSNDTNSRLAWTALAAGQSVRAIGDLIVALSEIGFLQSRLTVWEDLLLLAGDSVFVLGLLLLAERGHSFRERLRRLLDLGIAMTAALLISWTLVILPRSAESGAEAFVLFVPLGYAIADIVLTIISIDLFFDWLRSGRRISVLLLAGGALGKVAAGALGFALCPPNGVCQSGDWDAVVWLASAVLIGLGGLLQSGLASSHPPEVPLGRATRGKSSNYEAYFPYLWVVMAYLLLAWNYGHVPAAGFSVLLWCTGAITALVILRQILVMSENRKLYAAAQKEVVERGRAESEIRRLNEELEHRVIARTAQLETANRELQIILDSVRAWIFFKDKDNRFVRVNHAFAETMGMSKEELEGRSLFDLYPNEQADAFWNDDKAVMASGQAKTNILEPMDLESGRLWAQTDKIPYRDAEGNVIGIIGFAVDVTERKRAEEALALERNLLRTLIDNAPDYMYVKDTASRFVVGNLAVAHSLGKESPEEIYGKNDLDFHAPELAAQFLADEQAILSSGQALVNREEYVVLPAGDRRWLITTKVPLHDGQHKIVGLVGVGRDITERKRMEAELKESNQKLKVWVNQLEQSSREIALLGQMGDLLQSCRSADEAYQVIAGSGRALFPAESGALFVLNNSRNLVEMATHWGESRPAECTFVPDDCWGLRRGRPYLFEGPGSNIACPHLVKEAPASCLCIPMMAQGETLGVLHLRAAGSGLETPEQPFSVSAQQLAGTVAEHIALSLAGLQLRETLRSQAIRDPLTGLFNRRYMEETIERELHRATRNGTPLGIIMFDIDHFKDLNDRFGHGAGDAVLRELGAYLESKMRREDIACRYGGDEFILVLPECSIENSRRRAEQIHEEFDSRAVKFHHQFLPTVSFSFGVAASPPHGTSAESLLRRADQALYSAKAEGRDRVVVAE
jgi:diguanylate cyclase (GGDEF)-like protein/PAS domain S-box-containing protein